MEEAKLTANVKSMFLRVGKAQTIPWTYSGLDFVRFKSSNEAVCRVTSAGVLQPLKPGIVIVTLSAPGCMDVSVSAQVTL